MWPLFWLQMGVFDPNKRTFCPPVGIFVYICERLWPHNTPDVGLFQELNRENCCLNIFST